VALILDSLIIGAPADAQSDVIVPVAGNDTQGLPTSGQPGSSQSIGQPTDVAVDSQGNVYFVDPENSEVDFVSASTGLLTVLAGNGTSGAPDSGEVGTGQEIDDPYSLTVDSHGNVFFVDADNDEIDELTAPTINADGVVTSGDVLNVLADSGNGVDSPNDIAVDSSGNVFFSNSGNDTIEEISAANDYATTTVVAGTGTEGSPTSGEAGTSQEIGEPYHLVVDSSGNLYFADEENYEVDELTAPVINGSGDVTGGDILTALVGDGTSGGSTTPGISGSGQEIYWPLSVAVDSSGNVYFVDSEESEVGAVIELSAPQYNGEGQLIGGDILNILAGGGSGDEPTTGQTGYGVDIFDPYSVAVDSSGNVYFTDEKYYQVEELSPGSYTDGVLTGGDILTVLADTGAPNLPYYNSTDIAVTGGGNVYITDLSLDNDTYYVDEIQSEAAPIAFDSVTYASGGATGTLPTQNPVVDLGTFTVASGAGLTNPGYTFAGWSDGTSTYQPGATYTVGSNPVTLTAVWKAVSLTPVTYANGGGSGTLPTQASVQAGTSITLASGAGLTNPGYTFAGWSDGTSTYQPGATYTVGSNPVTLTAVWKAVSSTPSHLSDTVYFALDSSRLTPADLASLSAFAAKVKNANATNLNVVGYADSTGTEPQNHALSLARARAVAAALTADLAKLGVTTVSIHAVGGGVSTTYANSALNRRATVTS